jgi:hypothetical protein
LAPNFPARRKPPAPSSPIRCVVLDQPLSGTSISLRGEHPAQQPKNQPTPPNVMHPIAPRRRPFRPHSTYLFRLVLARSRCPSVSQASHFLAHSGRKRSWYPRQRPPSAAQPPRPNFLKGAPTGHGWRPPRAGRSPLYRRPPLGRPSRAAGASREAILTRAPPRSLYCRPGEESPRKATSVKTKTKGNRSTKRHATKGRGGTDKISLWRELIDMIEDKGLGVSAALVGICEAYTFSNKSQ